MYGTSQQQHVIIQITICQIIHTQFTTIYRDKQISRESDIVNDILTRVDKKTEKIPAI